MKPRAIIVGAGLGGLSAAITLASRGWNVTVYESQSEPGGKAGSETLGDYRFDTGPSLLTMPWVFDELFSAAGRNRSDYLTFRRLDPICHYFWSDGTTFRAPGEITRLPGALEASLGEPAKHTHRYFRNAGRVYDIAANLFLTRSLHDRSTYLSREFAKQLPRVGRIGALSTLDRLHRRFFTSPRVQQLFNRYATYNGSNPYLTPATMQIIPFVEYNYGGFAVVNGVRAIPAALAALARELGVEVRCDSPVRSIRWSQNGSRRPVDGVVLADGTFAAADIVVSNVDVSLTYPELLGDSQARQYRRYRALEPSSSGLVFSWGMDRSFPELAVNNIFFSDDYPAEFHSIFDENQVPDQPTIYLNITSKVTKDYAPATGENWFVLVNVPADGGHDWSAVSRQVRQAIVERVGRALGCQIAKHIVVESVLNPSDIAQRTGSYRGALYGIASNSRFASFARHPNRCRQYPGLYFCGGSVHPGGGMPLVILSGRIAADLASRDHHMGS